ncbi:MAG: FxLYD domain-containing protein [Gammaproteobacteria bacterium]|nr:FxLYD domain-containing protein [Gammaproteobacteria bacterium]
MELIKQFFAKIISGFLLGVGFVIAAGLLGGYAISHITTTAIDTKATEIEYEIPEYKSPYREYDETAKLQAIVKTENINNGLFSLLGEINNNGEYSWQMIQLKAELFDKSGKFIEQCEEYVSQTIKPNQTINFKLSCKSASCNAFEPKGYHSYKLIITEAQHITDE